MGKSTAGLFNIVHGKVGGVVGFHNANGRAWEKQGFRSYAGKVKNPRTKAQMYQRVKFASAIAAAQTLKPIINHSFQGVKYGEDSVREFTSRLLKKLSLIEDGALSAFNLKGVNTYQLPSNQVERGVAPLQIQISNGSLAAPSITKFDGHSSGISGGHVYGWLGSLGAHPGSLRPLAVDESPVEIWGSARRWFDYLGIEPGMQITLGFIFRDGAEVMYNRKHQTQTSLVIKRLVFKTEQQMLDNGNAADWLDTFTFLNTYGPEIDGRVNFTLNRDIIDTNKSDTILVGGNGNSEDLDVYGSAGFSITATDESSADLLGMFMIYSDVPDNTLTWRRSTSYITTDVLSQVSLDEAAASYAGVKNYSSNWYLNGSTGNRGSFNGD